MSLRRCSVNLEALHRTSLRHTLIAALLLGVVIGGAMQVYVTWRTAESAVNAAFDRSLYGAIRAIDASISTDSGGVGVELPYLLLEFFELTASGTVHYKVATEDGLVEIGSPDIPMPLKRPELRAPSFRTVDYLGSPTRVGTYIRPLGSPVGGNVIIQIAESLSSRKELSHQFILYAIGRELLLAVLAGSMATLAVAWLLRPLKQLREDVMARESDDLSAIDTRRVPADVLPLVEAMNHHLVRYRELLVTQRRFLDDASHQLRTPLATLLTQVTYALREPDNLQVRETLDAMRHQLRHTIRQANQLLALGRADTSSFAIRATNLHHLAGEVSRRFWPAARHKRVDLGIDGGEAAVDAEVNRELMQEALSNLIDNAIRHTPSGGHVTVRVESVGDRVLIHVDDMGPGIPGDELPQAAQRFFRASNAQGTGSGLGLAIVQSIANRHHGQLVLAPGPGGGGLRASIDLPATQPQRVQARAP